MGKASETIIGINGTYEFLTLMMWIALIVVNPIAFSNNRMAEAPFIVTIVLSSIAFIVGIINLGVMAGLTGRFFSWFGDSTGSKESAEATSISDYIYSAINFMFTTALAIYLPVEYDVYNNLSDWIFIVDIILVALIWLLSTAFGLYLILLGAGYLARAGSYVRNTALDNP